MKLDEPIIPKCISVDRVRNSRLSGNKSDINTELGQVYDYLVRRDGEQCANLNCRAKGSEVSLDVNHIDGNKFRHFHENLNFLCHKCNCRKNPKGWKKLSVSLSLSEIDPKPEDSKLYLKKRYLPEFLNYLEEEFQRTNRILYDKAITVGAFKAGMASKKTISEYLELLTCDDPLAPLLKKTDYRNDLDYIYLRNDVSGKLPPAKITALFKEFRKKFCN